MSVKVRKILFITGTRADYGKIKPLIRRVDDSDQFEAYVFVSGMHLLEKFGSTYEEVIKDKYKNIYTAFGLINSQSMSYNLGDVVCHLTGYVNNINPDMIVVHGDRIDALAGAIVGALNNIRVAHIEGGELSGSVDESIRHAISKFAHLHFVSNEEARNRILQLGEDSNHVFVIGSPDIDVMISDKLPALQLAKNRYSVNFDRYAILMYHPVTTELEELGDQIRSVVDAAIQSDLNYIVVYPNNDCGSDIILNEYRRFNNNPRIRVFPSLRFEYFLSFLKNADFMLGNSSAGVREACIYGVPAIDVGNRQTNRYRVSDKSNIQHIDGDLDDILSAIKQVDKYRKADLAFGSGNSTECFYNLILSECVWNTPIQKSFIDQD